MKSKDLLELKKMRQEIALIREAKNHIAHSLDWYKLSAESIEKNYQTLTNQLNWNEKQMKEAEKKIEAIVANYDMAGCNYCLCHEIKFKKEMKYSGEYYCDEDCFQKQEEIRRQYPGK